MPASRVSVVIPTFQRERILVETIEQVLALREAPTELIIVDQTTQHDAETAAFLREHEDRDTLRCVRLDQPSIPRAMNAGLAAAASDIVLFLDDDIEPSPGLIGAHAASHDAFPEAWAVVGQVLQPGTEPAPRNGWVPGRGFTSDLEFPFSSTERAWVSSVMAGNLSVKRVRALEAGGFDENFQGVAYRFETEFSRRLIARGGQVLFEPAASIRHLRAPRGGTRAAGSHLTSASPTHGMGDYYFALRAGLHAETIGYMLRRPLREVATRFHLRHPWFIPLKLVGELRAFGAAVRALARGPQYVSMPSPDDAHGKGGTR